MDVSVLGMGRMGQAIAGRLLDGGHRVTVWNRSPGKTEDLVSRGAAEAGSPAGAADGAEVVITMLAADDAVRAVATGDDGVVQGLADNAVYADASTVSPQTSAALAAAAGAARFVAMPILGAPAAVAAGAAVYLAGGDGGALDRLRPILGSLTDTVREYPEPQLAATAKLASNFLLLAGIAALAEAFAIGRGGGMADDQLRQLLAESPLVAPGLRNRFDGVLTGHQDPWWSVALGAKDARLAVEVATAAGVDVPLGQLVRDLYASAAGSHPGHDQDIAVVGDRYRP